MTAAEWLTATDPLLMFRALNGPVSERKARLIRVAAARSVWPELTHDRYRAAVEVGERHADGLAADGELKAQMNGMYGVFGSDGEAASGRPDQSTLNAYLLALACVNSPRLVQPAVGASWTSAARHTRTQLPGIVRDILGNPFRPVAFSPAWRETAAIEVARQMYDGRDFAAMPILADALQDAGCEDADVLAHCRGAGPHVRGCWVVDGVLGKG